MIYKKFLEVTEHYGNSLFLADFNKKFTYKQALVHVKNIARAIDRNKKERVYFYASDSAFLAIALLSTDMLGLEVCIINRQANIAEVEKTIGKIGPGLLITDCMEAQWQVPHIQSITNLFEGQVHPVKKSDIYGSFPLSFGKVIILTTGTTGIPKAVLYDWKRLLAQVSIVSGEFRARWLAIYPLNHFAGIQLFIHTLSNGNTLIFPRTRQIEDILQSIRKFRINAISATPTFFRIFTGQINEQIAKTLPLRHITLGGEICTLDILEKLKRLFPSASISQVYATTELGSCFSVKDGLPGFPNSYLNRRVGNVEIRIIDGELYIRSLHSMISYINGLMPETYGDWVATGDLVEVVGERVYFRGRKNETINVGGVKVFPQKVEEVILTVPGVLGVRAYGKSNPITGQIVAVDVQVSKSTDLQVTIELIKQRTRTELNRYEQPRDVRFVSSLVKRNEKIVRRINV